MNLELIIALAEQGKHEQPDLARRIDRALALIRTGKVERIDDDHYRVHSQQRDEVYEVNGDCTCPDAQGVCFTTSAPNGWCKHKLAVGLVKRARKLDGTVCPQCLSQLESASYYVGGIGYAFYLECAANKYHYSRRTS